MSQNITESIAAARLLESRIIDAKAALALLEADLAEHEKVITAAVKAVAVKDEKGTLRGELVTEQGTAKITWPIAALKLTEANIADVKKLAGDAWSKLAERVPVSHKLVKSARDLIPVLLTPARGQKLLALLEANAAAPRITYT
ncbi:MAG TPA: hypothetical protein VF614_04825 [Chthoniobacteraceae bacterium]|jgi:hypothetical protein